MEHIYKSNPELEAIARGTAAPTRAMLGQRESLAPSLQAKMQGAFDADLSNVEIYRSETARDAGFKGVASGNKVALSPDIDLNSHVGQSVLGHELSHVVAQAQGIGGGRGFLGNSSLERQADVQGEMAASGMRAIAGSGLPEAANLDFSAPTMTMGGTEAAGLTPISATTEAFGMGAPMQGKKEETPEQAVNWSDEGKAKNGRKSGESAYDAWQRARQSKRPYRLEKAVAERLAPDAPVDAKGFHSKDSFNRNIEGSQGMHQLNLSRVAHVLDGNVGKGVSETEAADMMEDLAAGKRGDPAGDARLERGMRTYKKMIHAHLLRMQERYGTMLTQMHPEDVFNHIDMEQFGLDIDSMQDMGQLDNSGNKTGVHVLDPNDPEDQEYIKLGEYYNSAATALSAYMVPSGGPNPMGMGNESKEETDFLFSAYGPERATALQYASAVSGPSMDEEQLAAYRQRSAKRLRKKGHSQEFIDRFWNL